MPRDTLALLLAAASVAGCATPPAFEGGREWEEGWREGTVEKVGAASELGSRYSYDCRYREGDGRASPGRFAVVALRKGGEHRHHVVPTPLGKEPAVGARVLTNTRGCEAPVLVDR